MSNYYIASLATLLLLTLGSTAIVAQTYTTSDGKVSFTSPCACILEDIEYEFDGAEGNIFGEVFTCVRSDSTKPYLIVELYYTHYPASYIHSDSSTTLVSGFVNSVGEFYSDANEYQLMTTSYETLNGFTGKQFGVKELSTGYQIRKQAYLVDSMLIELVVTNENWFSEVSSNSLKSLQLDSSLVQDAVLFTEVIDTASYTVNFPGSPTLMEQTVDSDLGPVHIRFQLLDLSQSSGALVYMSAESKFPGPVPATAAEEAARFSRSVQGAVSSMNGTLISVTPIEFAGLPGREFTMVSLDGALNGHFRILSKGNLIYQMGLMSSEVVPATTATAFFESFRLNN